MITIAGSHLTTLDSLTPTCRMALTLIEGGAEWLEWIIRTRDTEISFENEVELVVQIQSGLHQTEQVLLAGRQISIHARNLCELSEQEVKLICSNSTLSDPLRRLFASKGWSTFDELDGSRRTLDSLGVSDHPVFRTVSLADQIALHRFAKLLPTLGVSDANTSTEAATFAVDRAQTIEEFIDATVFSLATVAELKFTEAGTKRSHAVVRRWTELSRLCDDLLISPQLPPDTAVTIVEVYALMNQWLSDGHPVPFKTKASALSILMRQSPLRDESGAEARGIIEAFTKETAEFLVATEGTSLRPSQDGLSWQVRMESKAGEAILSLDSARTVTLSSYVGKEEGRLQAGA